MSGSIGPRFSFTHYPRGGNANGPGVALLRPIPDICAPSVTFLGMSPLECGGPGLAFGTLGPVLGEVGTTSARVLVEVNLQNMDYFRFSTPHQLAIGLTQSVHND